ncbi:hypothetical protein Taro_013250 [Colocasia esculenta]|uniref:Amidase domain-containing protein n=1 Tax=Colocasia esculenta TaxID=4460 RepID=A0A843ULL6_COLES|nr:hypothetical protein [Colocasia esculenta]
MEASKCLRLGRIHVSSRAKVWIIVGIGVAGAIILADSTRRRRRRGNAAGSERREDFGAFVERFELLPAPQLPPPAPRHPLSELTFAVSDSFDIKDYVTGFGNPDWKRTHAPASRTAVVVSLLLKHGGTCVGRTVMDELAFGITGENIHMGTPTNPDFPQLMPGGSASGSGVAVAAGLVDFALGTDTVGCVRIPAALCGIFGFRPSHGILSTIGVLMNSRSLETVGKRY